MGPVIHIFELAQTARRAGPTLQSKSHPYIGCAQCTLTSRQSQRRNKSLRHDLPLGKGTGGLLIDTSLNSLLFALFAGSRNFGVRVVLDILWRAGNDLPGFGPALPILHEKCSKDNVHRSDVDEAHESWGYLRETL